jgi:hypothetical protein
MVTSGNTGNICPWQVLIARYKTIEITAVPISSSASAATT